MVVHDLGEHQAGHGGRGFVRPAERPPDFVERFLLVDIVRHVGPARRMQPDRLAELVHFFPERQILRPVERLARDVGVDLHAERTELLDRALRLAHAGVGRIERYLRDPTGKMVAFLRAQFGEAVVDETDELVDLGRGFGEVFHRRLRVGQDLLIILVAVDDLLAMLEVEQRRQRAHALAHVLVVAGDVLHLVEEFFRKEVRVRVDPHLRPSSFGTCACYPLDRPESIARRATRRRCSRCRAGRSRRGSA